MVRLILISLLFLLSLLVVFRAPTSFLWYVSILVTEFCWLFIVLLVVLLLWKFGTPRYHTATMMIGGIATVLFFLPLLQAQLLSQRLAKDFDATFKPSTSSATDAAFHPLQMITGIGAKKVAFSTVTYDAINKLTLDYYPSPYQGSKPCVIVIHGGSWAGGNSQQLPELNSELAQEGYQVASINYRLAPQYKFPAPVEDVRAAIAYLRSHARELAIDTSRFFLLGRSAGGEIALSAAYTLNDKNIKGVISFYGPTDMVWGYENPTNPLVLNSKKIMEDYLGGTLTQVRNQYLNSSPTETLTGYLPPTLLIYGHHDPLVSHLHSNRLTKKLKLLGVPYYELFLPWATHGFDYTLNGPGGQLSTWTVKRFLASINQAPVE